MNMKIFDSKGRLFGKISIIDVLIIAFIAAAAGGAYLFLQENSEKAKSTKSYNVVLEYRGIDEDFCDSIIPGRTVFERVQNQPIGKLVDVKITPDMEYTISSVDGTIKEYRVPGKCDAKLYLEITTDTPIFVGKYLSIGTKDFTGAGYIIDFSEVE